MKLIASIFWQVLHLHHPGPPDPEPKYCVYVHGFKGGLSSVRMESIFRQVGGRPAGGMAFLYTGDGHPGAGGREAVMR
jgi:hypothetical protein